MLTEAQIQRFSRHILLREVGGRGQEALLAACVRVPTLDAAGRACALWLARAGVGSLCLPEDATPAPTLDAAGLLRGADAGAPLGAAVRERLLFHRPDLRFGGAPTAEAAPAADATSGTLAALAVVRSIIQAGLD